MKKTIYVIALSVLVLGFFACKGNKTEKVSADTEKSEEVAHVHKASFKVGGACGMCKTRIEKTASEFEGIESAEWNQETSMLAVKYNDDADLDDLHKKIAAVGHDTEKEKAPDDVYEALPGCCHYR